MRYRATVHHNGLHPGDEVTVDDVQREQYAFEIDREFLVPVEDIDAWEPDSPSFHDLTQAPEHTGPAGVDPAALIAYVEAGEAADAPAAE